MRDLRLNSLTGPPKRELRFPRFNWHFHFFVQDEPLNSQRGTQEKVVSFIMLVFTFICTTGC